MVDCTAETKIGLEEILGKEMRGERIPEEELSPEAVELLVKCRSEPEDIVELFRRPETLKDYLMLPKDERSDVRNRLVRYRSNIEEGRGYKGSANWFDKGVMWENSAYRAAEAYVDFVKKLSVRDVVDFMKNHRCQNFWERHGLRNFLRIGSKENGKITMKKHGKRGSGAGQWNSFYESHLRGDIEKFFGYLKGRDLEQQARDADRKVAALANEEYPKHLAKEAAKAYVGFESSLSAEDVYVYARKHNRSRIEGHYGLKHFLRCARPANDPKKVLFRSCGPWTSLHSKGVDEFYNILRTADEELEQQVKNAEDRMANIIDGKYPEYLTELAAKTYISYVDKITLQDLINSKRESKWDFSFRNFTLNKFRKILPRTYNLHKRLLDIRLPRAHKLRKRLLDILKKNEILEQEVQKAEERINHLSDIEYHGHLAKEAAKAYIKFADGLKVQDIVASAKRNVLYSSSYGLPNFLRNGTIRNGHVKIRYRFSGDWNALFRCQLDDDPEKFYDLLKKNDKTLEQQVRKTEQKAIDLVKTEYPKYLATEAAEAYIKFIENLRLEHLVRSTAGNLRSHNNLRKKYDIPKFLRNAVIEAGDIKIKEDDQGAGKWKNLIQHYLNGSLEKFYELLSNNHSVLNSLERAKTRLNKLVETYWKHLITEFIDNGSPILEGATPRPQSIGSVKPFYIGLLSYYQFNHDEKEKLLMDIIKINAETFDSRELDRKHGLEETIQQREKAAKLRYKILAEDNKRPWQMFSYLEHTNALKIIIGDLLKYERLACQLYPELLRDGVVGLEAKGLAVDTRETWIKENSLNPNFRIDLILKPKNDEYGLNEQVNTIFLKLFNNPDRWKHECKVSRELSSLGIPVIPPRAITLNEDYFKLIERASLDPDMPTLTLPSLIGNHHGKDYHFALASQFVDGQTLRDTIKNTWTQLEEEAAEEPGIRKGLLERKYQALQEPLKKVNYILKQLHSIKPGKILENQLETRDYQNFFRNRIDQITKFTSAETISNANLTSNAHAEYRAALADLNRAYTNSGIGMELEKALQKYKTVVHGDLHSSNLLVTNNELKLIDTEFAALGLPQEDLATQLSEPHFITQEKSAEKTARAYANKFIDNYMDTMQITEKEDFLASTGLFGMTRSSMLLAAHAVKSRYAAQEAKQEFRKTCDRHLKAIDYFAEMATTNRPNLEPRVTAFAARVRQLSLPKAA